ncbi:MAG: DUF2125 domain-containing protein [Rhodospirillaceae bacterium]|nr:DUF2125 domain-containing protein [Rhodospirillaceae bacterium]
MNNGLVIKRFLRNQFVVWPLLGLVIAFVLYCTAWFGAATVLQNQAQRWIEAQRSSGLSVSHGDPLLSGFPRRVVVSYPEWETAVPATSGGWTWRTATVSLRAEPWAPFRFTVDLAGQHSLSGLWTPPGIAAWITARQFDIKPVLTTSGQVAEIAVELAEVSVANEPDSTAFASVATANWSMTKQASANTNEPTLWRLVISVTNASASGLGQIGPFAPTIKSLRITADMTRPVGSGPLPNVLEAWRQDGGTLELREFTLDWPPLSISASGTVAVDSNLQPIGALSAKFRGFFETVATLASQGLVRSSEASMARIVLGLLSRKPDAGGPPEINLAVTVQNQKLYTGPLPLLDLPRVEWPAAVTLP